MSGVLRLIRACLAALCLGVLLGGAAEAQLSAQDRDYYQSWLKTADRAEDVIDADRASSVALEVLRQEIAEYRERFNQARGANAARIKTLEGQLGALGPAPESGEEPADIAALRGSLREQLNELTVPRVVSEEAYNRANGLIGEIDRIIRSRRTKALLARSPTPLNPEYWGPAAADLGQALGSVWNETRLRIGQATTRERIQNSLPLILALAVGGLLLVLRSRRWAEHTGEYMRRFGGRGTGVWSFFVSLVQVALPLFGVVLITQAVDVADILGVRGSLILERVPGWAAILLLFNWLGLQLFSPHGDNDLVPVQHGRRGEVRFLIEMGAVMLVLRDLINLFEQIESISAASRSVVAFPVIFFTALVLVRLQRIGMQRKDSVPEGSETVIAAGASRAIRIVRRMAYGLGLLAPVLAAFGYIVAAEALIYPVASTLFVLSTALILQRLVADIYGLVRGRADGVQDSLFIVLAGFVLTLLTLPLLALIWGARVADLTELWAKFLAGFSIGETVVSPASFLVFVLVFAAGYAATRAVQASLRNSLLPKTRLDSGGQNAVVSGTGYVGIFLSAVVAISWTGLDLSSLAIVAGALSVGIGFGLQTVVSNFVSGIILLVERPVAKGDWIEVGGLMGYVRDISVRSTRIETFDRTDVIVPNSDLITGTVTNYTRGNTVGRVIVPVGVAYGTDPRRVEAILMEIAQAHPMVLMNPAPSIVFQGFGADSLDFEIRAILRDVNWVLSVRSDMNHEIARRFAEEGIEIPFAQRDIWLRNPEALTGAAKPAPAGPAAAAAQEPPAEKPEKPDTSDLAEPEADSDY